MKTQRHELHLLTGSYALNALPDDERGDFERHLIRCPSCAEEVRGLQETAARLAMATAVTPPPGMRAQVLAAVPRTRQLPPGARHALARTGGRTGLRRISLSRASVTTGILTLAAAVAFLLVTQLSTNQKLQQANSANGTITAVLAAPDARLERVQTTVGGRVTAVVSLGHNEAVVTTADLPDQTASKVYQLWVINPAGAARSAGLLPMPSSGSTAPVLARDVAQGDQLGITVEPAGGTQQPTTTPVVLVPVTA